jgi:hypothetical protein
MIRALVVATMLACCGCTNFAHPIVAEGGRTLDAALIGTWQATDGDERIEIEVRREGADGRAVLRHEKAGRDVETSEWRVITARLEQFDYASAYLLGEQNVHWMLMTYQVRGERLTVRLDANEFWRRAVEEQIVPGGVEPHEFGSRVSVTASEAQMRAAVRGYGALIFSEQPDFELTRVRPAR